MVHWCSYIDNIKLLCFCHYLDHLEIVRFISENRLLSIPASEAANKVAEMLQLDTATMADPPDDIKKMVRILCRYCIKHDRVDIVKELRKTLPSGMTGWWEILTPLI